MSRKHWTTEEVDFLNRKSTSLSLKELSDKLDRPVKMVHWKCRQLGIDTVDGRKSLPGVPSTVWTEDNLSYLRDNAKTRSEAQIANSLGLSQKQVHQSREYYGIEGRGRHPGHTPEGISAIKDKARARREAKYPPDGPWPCLRCREIKPVSDFPSETRTSHVCRSCARLHRVEKMYGLPAEKYLELLKTQNHQCAICFQGETWEQFGKIVPLSVDHDHSCCPGKKSCGNCVRGLLCASCNHGLGKFESRGVSMQAISDYLTVW